jgi:hypothetical protein
MAIVDGHLENALNQVTRYVERADELGAPRSPAENGLVAGW